VEYHVAALGSGAFVVYGVTAVRAQTNIFRINLDRGAVFVTADRDLGIRYPAGEYVIPTVHQFYQLGSRAEIETS